MVCSLWNKPCGWSCTNLEKPGRFSNKSWAIRFMSLSWNRKNKAFLCISAFNKGFLWRSPKRIKSELSMSILHHATSFFIISHHFTTANTFCAKGSTRLLVPLYCKFLCIAKLSFVGSFLSWYHKIKKITSNICHLDVFLMTDVLLLFWKHQIYFFKDATTMNINAGFYLSFSAPRFIPSKLGENNVSSEKLKIVSDVFLFASWWFKGGDVIIKSHVETSCPLGASFQTHCFFVPHGTLYIVGDL